MNARNTMATLTILSTLLSACAEEAVDDDIALIDADDDEGLRPFHVAVFDHEPTEEEIEAEFQEFQDSIDDLVAEDDPVESIGPMGFINPAVGQKLIRLDAVTSDITNAGTDDSAAIWFTGKWQVGNLQEYSETFVLNNPNVDDLDRNTTTIFYYLVNLGQYVPGATQDRFVQGKIINAGTDGWHCSQLKVKDRNHFGFERNQSLPFNQWVDSPVAPESAWMNGNNPAWMGYN